MDRMLATWFGAGLLRPAPGTWGSAVAVAMGLILHRIGHFPLLALATSYWSHGRMSIEFRSRSA